MQWTPFTSGPACLQMMLGHAGVRISHLKATRELKAFPGGTYMEEFQRVYRTYTGRKLGRITYKGILRALNRGVPVLAVDTVESTSDHLVVVHGYDGESYHVHDPSIFSFAKGFNRRKRMLKELKEAAGDEFYAPRSV